MGYNDNRFFSHRKAHYGSVSFSQAGSKDVNFRKEYTKMEELEKLAKFYKNGSTRQN